MFPFDPAGVGIMTNKCGVVDDRESVFLRIRLGTWPDQQDRWDTFEGHWTASIVEDESGEGRRVLKTWGRQVSIA